MQRLYFSVIFSFFLLLHCSSGIAASDDVIKLLLNIPSFTLEIYQNDKLIHSYPVAVGKASTPTPTGNFYIQTKETDPTWIPYPEKIVLAGPNNPLGIRWLGFYKTYGLHGTNMPNSIGQAASNGCIRMNNEHVVEVYNMVPIGTPFTIVYQVLQVRQNDNSEISIAAFPDIYDWGGLSLSNAYNTLNYYGFDSNTIDKENLLNILREHNGTFTPIGTAENITLYGQKITEKAITLNKETYLPLTPLLIITSLPIKWSNDKSSFNVYGINYNVRNINKQPYLTESAAVRLFAIKINRKDKQSSIEISNANPM